MEHLIKSNPLLAEDTLTDHNNVDMLMNTSHGLKIFELVILIMNISYFIGIIFMIVAQLNMAIGRMIDEDTDMEYFIEYFSIDSSEYSYNTILIMYYAFTSLSTVGFGDLHPRSDIERIFCSFMLLFGVAIFSYLMSCFIDILEETKASNADPELHEELSKFFGLMKKFNKGKQIDEKFKYEIEHYF